MVTPIAMPAPVVPPTPKRDTILRDSNVGFTAGTAVLRDPAAASEVLGPVAAALQRETRSITLFGTTASWGTASYRRALAAARASAIKRLLVNLGVPAERMKVVALGATNAWHVPDTDAVGQLLPGPAAMNRTVRIHVG